MMKDRRNEPQMELVVKVLDEAARILMAQLPHLRIFTEQVIDLIFVPKVIAKQLALLVALETGLVTLHQLTTIVQWVVSNFSSRSRLIRQLQEEQRISSSQDEWMDLAERIDNIQGNDVWRSDPHCPLYERERIAARIDEFVHIMRRRDIFELMFVLRGGIGRNKFGLLHEGLFTKALAGSKVLVETYHNVVCAALDFVCDAPVVPHEEPIPTEARLAFFNETRHAYGRTALLLSGGAALGFYHVGVVKTLMENHLMPRVIGGSSAGSIVCAMVGTRTDEECVQDLFQVKGSDSDGHSGRLAFNFFRPIPKLEVIQRDQAPLRTRNPFVEVYNNTAGAFHDAKLTLQGFVPIPMRKFSSLIYDIVTGSTRAQDVFKNDTAHMRDCVRANVGNFTFQEAFDRTGRILNIVVTPQNSSDPPRLLNYLTAPHVLVWSAAVASSSLPGVFEANRLVVKEADGWERYESGGNQAFSDGSMEQDLPMQQLSEMFNINHFIISQANPHAVMFASYNQKVSVWTNPFTGVLHQILVFVKDQVRSWLLHLVSFIGARRITPLFETQRGVGAQFFTQEYEGRSCDISLIPWLGHRGLLSAVLHVIYNPSEAEFREWIQAAERETWKYIPAIKSHIAEEITLDRCVQRLRRRIVQESWEKTAVKAGNDIGNRVPSFFTSNSLVNLSGLGVADQPSVEHLHDYTSQPTQPPGQLVPQVNHNSGWGGMGLKGNRSSGNLQRSTSDASGLFIEEDGQQRESRHQDAGEKTSMDSKYSFDEINQQKKCGSILDSKENIYIKTSSMANFYYRHCRNDKSTIAGERSNVPRTSSDTFVNRHSSMTTRSGQVPKARHARQKSKSHADLDSAFESAQCD